MSIKGCIFSLFIFQFAWSTCLLGAVSREWWIGYTLTISAIDELVVNGTLATMTINSTTGGAGTGLQSVNGSGLGYYLSTNGTGRYLKARISGSSLPSGLSLAVSANAPSGATSLGSVTLGASNVNLVSGIAQRFVSSGSAQPITVTLVPTAMVAWLTEGSTTVTFTLSP